MAADKARADRPAALGRNRAIQARLSLPVMAPPGPDTGLDLRLLPDPRAILVLAERENFAVASRLMGPRLRDHLMAIYGYCRLADHLGDESGDDGPLPAAEALDWLESDVRRLFAGKSAQYPLVEALRPAVERFAIPMKPFLALIEANRQDQRVTRYQSFNDLVEYCRLSANPVGHMVLHVFEAATAENLTLSDAICTALQITEHLQDVAEDYARGRIYLPLEDMTRFGVIEQTIADRTPTGEFRALMAYEAARTRDLFKDGLPLVNRLSGRRRLALAGFAGGGLAALDALKEAGFDVFTRRPRPSKARRANTVARVALGAARVR
ncbi:MAG TPA: squalene synthase HpnC [Actinomycetota bacterium]|nr:squalene synthase HpnC [Actinomycetota bacterium]